MTLIVKRKVSQTWPEAIEDRLVDLGRRDDLPACLSEFHRRLASGQDEAAAAYLALSALGLLWSVDLPGAAPGEPGPDRPG